MMTPGSAKEKLTAISTAVVERIGQSTAKEKIAGAAALGLALGVAATALGSSLLHDKAPGKKARPTKKPTA